MPHRRLKKHFEMAGEEGYFPASGLYTGPLPVPRHFCCSLTTRSCKQWHVLVYKFSRIDSKFIDGDITRDFSIISIGFGEGPYILNKHYIVLNAVVLFLRFLFNQPLSLASVLTSSCWRNSFHLSCRQQKPPSSVRQCIFYLCIRNE